MIDRHMTDQTMSPAKYQCTCDQQRGATDSYTRDQQPCVSDQSTCKEKRCATNYGHSTLFNHDSLPVVQNELSRTT